MINLLNLFQVFRFLQPILTDETCQFNQITKQFTLFFPFFPLEPTGFLEEDANRMFFLPLVTLWTFTCFIKEDLRQYVRHTSRLWTA